MKRLALVLALLGAACLPPEDPAAAYRAFTTDVQRGDQPKAWARLSKATREKLTEAAKKAAEARHKPVPKDGMQLAFGEGYLLARKVQRIQVLSKTDDRAQLDVQDDRDGRELVTLVREEGAWRVDLVRELSEASGR